jgi:hypothetical protein
MTPAEAGELLRYIVSMDGRSVTELTVESWAGILEHQSLADALRAAKWHYRDSNERLMPVHIVRACDDPFTAWMDS